jgi:hypothetical protein
MRRNDIELQAHDAEHSGAADNTETGRMYPRLAELIRRLRPSTTIQSCVCGFRYAPHRLGPAHIDHPCKVDELGDYQPGQCVFLCVQGKRSERRLVRVPCHRPTNYRKSFSRQHGYIGAINLRKKPRPRETACESDMAIYLKLKYALYKHEGSWKKWIPFFGVLAVHEVQVSIFQCWL